MQSNDNLPGTLESALIPLETRGWAGDEFIISYNEEPGQFDARTPDVAISPPGSPWAGSMHAVWAEMNNSQEYPFVEIHYSMSQPWERGLSWSNDEFGEGDRLISQDRTATSNANPGDASTPSIAIDYMGWLHVVWAEQYPDLTYEVHYTRSQDNGITWSGFDQKEDMVISDPSGQNSQWINQPRIAVTSSPLTIHVVWDEVSEMGGTTNVWYVRSSTQGNSWSQQFQINPPAAPGLSPPSHPDIATSGLGGEIVHILWEQEFEVSPGMYAEDIYYSRSMNAGLDWEPIRCISHVTPETHIERPRISAFEDDIYVIWGQTDYSMPGSTTELYCSASQDNGDTWNGEFQDHMISFPDGNDAYSPAISSYSGPEGKEVHVVWVEKDETSPLGTAEIHHSMSSNPMDPISWTGIEQDVVLSLPDAETFAEAMNPIVAVGVVGGNLGPHIFWEELNTAEPPGKADRNNEIHYLPDQIFDIPVHLGWNLISVPLIQENTSILAVLDDSQGDENTLWDSVKYYSNDGSQRVWASYNTNVPQDICTLSDIDHTMGIWVKVTSLGDGFLTVYGDYGTSTQITLYAGWNLVGYPAQTSKSITDALGTIHDLPVEGYDSNSTYMISQLPGSYMMQPGEGYWVHVASDTVWTIDW